MDKTLSTFHASNVVLQQHYREKGFKKYSELSSHLLMAEQNNNLLMKNHELRPAGSTPFPEVNEVYAHYARHGRGHRSGRGRGRGRGRGQGRDYGQERNHVPGVNHSPNKWFHQNEQRRSDKHETGKTCVCFKCGAKGHYQRGCRTPKHLVELYQASLKKKGKSPEANFVSKNHVDIAHLDVADFFENPEGKIDHLIGDGSVATEE
ncbi:uncharacterized protein LOC107855720 [Capsicum annuum]|uniref:uncharacterized protein LOC107855720 n=1 Tax=Capsicum annuum TaxID=4072 RepID=UPI001FB0C0E0|nr:uncharacterized protein LOC107855720 [Capsicum annuum]